MNSKHQSVRIIDLPPIPELKVPKWMASPQIAPSVRSIYVYFGQVILTPDDAKEPAADFAATLTPDYQAQLASSKGVSVSFGGKQDLCCIVFHSVTALQAWQEYNPALKRTLTTYLPDGSHMFVWLRIPPKERPPDISYAEVSWHGAARTIKLTELGGPSHVVMCADPPRQTAFAALSWSFCRNLTFSFGYGELLLCHGEPTLVGADGNARLNTEFWAAVATRELGLRYDRREGVFRVAHPDGAGDCPVSQEWVERAVERLLLAQSQAPGCDKLTAVYDPRKLREVRERIAVCGAIDTGAGSLTVEQYVQLALTPSPGGAVTSQEVLEDYRRMCRELNAPVPPEKVFYQRLKRAVMEIHGIGKSASIRRPGGQKNGYRGLRLKLREG